MGNIGSTTITNEEYLELISIKEKTKDYDELKRLVEEAKEVGLKNIGVMVKQSLSDDAKREIEKLGRGFWNAWSKKTSDALVQDIVSLATNQNSYKENTVFLNKRELENRWIRENEPQLKTKIEAEVMQILSKEREEISMEREEISKQKEELKREKEVVDEMNKKLEEYDLFNLAVNTQYDIINNLLDKLIQIKKLAKDRIFIRKQVLDIIKECKFDDVKNKNKIL
jgi:hypothetical protein